MQQQAPCEDELAIGSGQGTPLGHIQREVSCPSPRWRGYVRARIEVVAQVPMAVRRISRGQVLSRQDLVMAERRLSLADQDLVFRQSQLIGQSARRGLRPNQPIRHSQIHVPHLVSLGDEVLIRAGQGDFAATMTGTALENGAKGEGIRVRNQSSGRVITAYPISNGIVETRF
ncbi:hypothetical protein GCM10023333_22540 [Ferrimonas pelagia]|uniref:Flagella basal body P-ring formation protein FlgA n=1 Tax=Ferrimonas pelagia TaxID=1177826 RepID=A0ABP9EYQ5_9GAMM